jgi:hypothetical protein
MIAGTTAYDNNPAALTYLEGIWASPAPAMTYGMRLQTLQDPANLRPYHLRSTTVFSDGAANTLVGTSGVDWMIW